MAFPTVESVTPTVEGNTSAHTIDMPATVNAGDALVMVTVNHDGASASASASGWTEIGEIADNGFQVLHVLAKVADGSEGGTAVTVSMSSSTSMIAHTYRISGWEGSINGVAASDGDNVGETTSPNPDSLSPGWGTAEILWIAACGASDNDSVTGAPSNYTNLTANTNSSGDDISLGTARRNLEASSENPGAFSANESFWSVITVAVRPSTGTTHQETAASSVSVTGAAEGRAVHRNTAATSVSVTGAAEAHAVRQATAAASVTVSTSATAQSQPRRESAASSISVSATAEGRAVRKGSAAVSVEVAGAGEARAVHRTTATSDITVTASAEARLVVPPKQGSGTSNVTVSCLAAAKRVARQTASCTITVTTRGLAWRPREHTEGGYAPLVSSGQTAVTVADSTTKATSEAEGLVSTTAPGGQADTENPGGLAELED